MTTLAKRSDGELWLTLRGEAENRILTVVRHWPHWLRFDIERDPHDSTVCLSVTLIADQSHETVVREILKRSFSLTFPEAGGDAKLEPEQPASPRKRRWR